MRQTIVAVCATLACCGISSSARGQDLSRVEVAAGYTLAMIRHDFDWKPYQGWAIEEATFVRPRLAVPITVDGVYWNWTAPNTPTVGEKHHRLGFLAGVRATGDRHGSMTPFVEVLAGVVRASYRLYGLSESDFVGSDSAFAIQPGGGFDLRLNRWLSVRASVDARVASPRFATAWKYPEWRFGAGLSYRANK